MTTPTITPSTLTYDSASPAVRADYHAWLALGPGGIPATWASYLFQAEIGRSPAASTDTVTVAVYADPARSAPGWAAATAAQRARAQRSFLAAAEPLPVREGPRARPKEFVFPQRQREADQEMDAEVREAYQSLFTRLGATHSGTTEWATSQLEKHGRALFVTPELLSEPPDPLVAPARREIAHIHASDQSGHVTLSLADAAEVCTKGWGERHRLSGTEWLHLGYTMLYVPRSMAEVEVLGKILQAGVEYMTSGAGEE